MANASNLTATDETVVALPAASTGADGSASVDAAAAVPTGARLQVALTEQRTPNLVRLDLGVTRYDAAGEPQTTTSYFFEFTGDVLPSPQRTADLATLAMLFPAMRAGLPLYVTGPVSRTLLRNLEEFQDVWRAWCPGLYDRVPLIADSVVDTGCHARRRAAMLYSGGVDANSTLLAQLFERQRHRTYDIALAILVHGFDTPLERTREFDEHQARAREILGRHGIPLATVRTDWRCCGINYTHGHGTALTACLHAFAGDVEVGLLASDRNYRYNPRSPNGSNPLTNPMLSSDALLVVTDGAGLTRSEKVARIAQHPFIRDRLQVCFTRNSTNCCICEKCIRTILNFQAQGLDPGPAFPRRPAWWRILINFYWISPTAIHYYREIVATSRRQGTLRALRPLLRLVIVTAQAKTTLRRLLASARSRR